MSKRAIIAHIRRRTGEIGSSSLESHVALRRAMPGGAYRDRTDDLKLAKLALSQLS